MVLAFKKRAPSMVLLDTNGIENPSKSGFMTVHYHNKEIGLPRLLNNRCVRDAVPTFLKPPMVSYAYTRSNWGGGGGGGGRDITK